MGLEKIEEYKKRLGMTTAELSEKSGVPKGTLDKILSGVTRDPKLETLKAVSYTHLQSYKKVENKQQAARNER